MKLKLFSTLAFILVCIQFINTNNNTTNDDTNAIWNTYPTSDVVKPKLKTACLDCHSNQSEYPWYAKIQPVSYWLSRHINGGKKHLNYSDFTTKSIARQNHKLEETIEVINEGEMPLKSYTYLGLHSEANMTVEDKKLIIDWAQSIIDSMKQIYPADSLVMKKKQAYFEKNGK
jgi:hypothetical protein